MTDLVKQKKPLLRSLAGLLLGAAKERVCLLIVRFFYKYWLLVIALVGLSFVSSTLTSVTPLFLAPVLEIGAQLGAVAPAASLSTLNLNNVGATILNLFCANCAGDAVSFVTMVALLFVVASILAALTDFATHLMSNWLSSLTARDVQSAMYHQLLSLDLTYFSRNKVGELAGRFVADVGEATNAFDLIIRHVLQSLIQLSIYGWLLFSTSPRLASITMMVGLIHVAINKLIGRRLRQSSVERFSQQGNIGAAIGDGLTNIRTIKSFGSEHFEHEKFVAVAQRVLQSTLRYFFHKHVETPLRRIGDAVAIGVVLVVAYMDMRAGNITLPGFLLFIVIARIAIIPVSTLAQALTRIDGAAGPSERILQVLEATSRIESGKQLCTGFAQDLRFEHVTFAYDGGEAVLREVSFGLRKGEIVAVVGPSGAGKSSLLDLVMRIHDPDKGAILLDGMNIRTFETASYRKLFGVVSQDNILFHDTVRENILCGRRGIAEADIVRAAQAARIHDFIMSLPDRYDTIVGERGTRLSGGQRQRIALARAFCGNPSILLLDEATSALDPESERQVQEAIDAAITGASALVVAHRLSTIQRANRIIVMEQGRVRSIGSHDELMSRDALYRKLYELQFRQASGAGAAEGDAPA